MTKILFVCGSQREDSYNARLLRRLGETTGDQVEIDFLLPSEVRLPIFDQDLEADGVWLQHTESIHQRIYQCDGLVVASPEYNAQLTPYLKNMVDWVSRLAYLDSRFANPFLDHPVLLCSASTGWSGGALAVTQARALFGYVGATVLGGAVCLPYAQQAWSEFGYMFEPEFQQNAVYSLERLVQSADQFSRVRGLSPPA
jgi:NAD(P)H-dependent FMN reductase